MSAGMTMEAKKKTSYIAPSHDIKPRWTSISPQYENNSLATSERSHSENQIESGFGHSFSRIRVLSDETGSNQSDRAMNERSRSIPQIGDRTPVMQECPLALTSPRLCPFGGACHTCPPHIQAKLSVNQPDDKYEQEADGIAEKVMRMADPSQQQAIPVSSKSGDLVIQRECPECEDDEESLQRKGLSEQGIAVSNHSMDMPPIVHEVLRSPGQPLDSSTRAFMEPRFGHDFSRVRVHTDAKATKSAQTVNSLAYTFGNNVVFRAGLYTPNTMTGQRLLAHELTHVLQQYNGQSTSLQRQSEETEEDANQTITATTSAQTTAATTTATTTTATTAAPITVTVNGITYYNTRAGAEAAVPTHVSPRSCFVWRDGPTGHPWRVIPGTGCAHWVAHQRGISGPGCYDNYALRVSQVVAGLTSYNLPNARVGDIWTNIGGSHTGIVRGINTNSAGTVISVNVEHCSSGSGGVVTSTFTSGYFYR
ncbi:MAG: DUF4157 domain-containing protein [Candidatus Poribacteria bacterium]